MKKTNLYILLLMLCGLAKAQVGINTDTPTRTLDVNGEMRVRELKYPTPDIINDYDQVLVTDADGNIDYWDKAAIQQEFVIPMVETKKLYFASEPHADYTVTCGKVNLRFNINSQPEINLAPGVTSGADLYITRIRMWATNNKEIYANIPIRIPNNADYTNNWIRIDDIINRDSNGSYTTITGYIINHKDEYYFSFPGETSFYRITFLARTMSPTVNSYTMICEKF